jgi:hypothetical protein
MNGLHTHTARRSDYTPKQRGVRKKNNSRQYIIVALHKEYKQKYLLNGYSVLCVSKLKFIGAQTPTMLVLDKRT